MSNDSGGISFGGALIITLLVLTILGHIAWQSWLIFLAIGAGMVVAMLVGAAIAGVGMSVRGLWRNWRRHRRNRAELLRRLRGEKR